MLSDAARVAQLVDHPRFHAGDRVVLRQGPHRFVSGTFLHLNDDVEWASIEQSNGQIHSHPVEWMEEHIGSESLLCESNHVPE